MPKKQRIYDYFYEFASEALHIVIFENFVKSMTSCLSKLKVTPSFYFAFKNPDNPTASTIEQILISFCQQSKWSTYFCFIPYWSSELPITLRLKDGVYGEAGNNFSLRQSLFEHQTAPHFYDKIKSPAFLHIYYIQLLKLQIRVSKKAAVTLKWFVSILAQVLLI